MTTQNTETSIKTGPIAAAIISSGIGSMFIGLMTTGAVLSPGLKNLLNLWNPAGPLTGKTTVGILAWLISWFFLNSSLKDKDYELNKAFILTLILLGIGLFFTFPLVFEAFE